MTRRELVEFRWAGGDAAVDAPRGAAFVTVERRVAGRLGPVRDRRRLPGHHRAHAGGPLVDGDLPVRRLRPARQLPLPRARPGRSRRRQGAAPYEAVSKPFELKPMTLALAAGDRGERRRHRARRLSRPGRDDADGAAAAGARRVGRAAGRQARHAHARRRRALRLGREGARRARPCEYARLPTPAATAPLRDRQRHPGRPRHGGGRHQPRWPTRSRAPSTTTRSRSGPTPASGRACAAPAASSSAGCAPCCRTS